MNKDDKFHDISPEFENNVYELSDDALENISGGMDAKAKLYGGDPVCPRCGGWMMTVCSTNGTPDDFSDDATITQCMICRYCM